MAMPCEDVPESAETTHWRSTLAGVGLTFAIIASIAFALRWYASRTTSAKLRADDMLMGCAVVLMWGDTASILLKAYNGIGVPADLLPHCRRIRFDLGSWLVPKFWATSMACAKVSTILFLRRVVGLTRAVNMALVLAGLVVIGWAAVLLFYTTFMCKPVSYYWDKSIHGGRCVENDKLMRQNIATGFLALASDVAILVIPLPTIWRLQMKRKRKGVVTFVLSAGIIVCAFSLLRVLQFFHFDINHLSTSSNLESIWTILENNLSILCGCAPHMASFFQNLGQINAKSVGYWRQCDPSTPRTGHHDAGNTWAAASETKGRLTNHSCDGPTGTRTSSEIELQGITVPP